MHPDILGLALTACIADSEACVCVIHQQHLIIFRITGHVTFRCILCFTVEFSKDGRGSSCLTHSLTFSVGVDLFEIKYSSSGGNLTVCQEGREFRTFL